MSILSKIIGVLLTVAGGALVILGNGDLVWFFIGILVASVGLSLLQGGKKPTEHEPPPPTVTEIHCDNSSCDFKEIREFQSGDYILKPVAAKCPKCESAMTIEGVYVVREDKESDKVRI
jgi:hypothetical protein